MSAPAAAGPPLAPPRPAWTTSEFWSTVFVHAFAVVMVVLTFTTGSDEGIQGAEAIVPAAAMLASAVAHVAYVRGRVHLKLGRMAEKVEADVRAVEPFAREVAPVVVAADPALAQRISAAVAAGRAVEPPATPTPPDATMPAQ
jgi:hypothetical protein